MQRKGSGLGTAGWIAAARARESARTDRLFDDPWANLLAGESGQAQLRASEQVTGENRFLPVRTRFFDDVIVDASSWADQLVLLGAGLDTRAYRLSLPAPMSVFEIDLPDLLAVKEAALGGVGARATCTRRVVGIDLRADWAGALLAAGFDPARPTAWLAEGLLFYLDAPTAERLIAQAATLSAGRSVLALDVFGTGLLRLPHMRAAIRSREAAGRSAPFCTDDPVGLLRSCGWQDVAVTEPGQSAANFGRLPLVPDDWAGGSDPGMRTYLAVAGRPRATKSA